MESIICMSVFHTKGSFLKNFTVFFRFSPAFLNDQMVCRVITFSLASATESSLYFLLKYFPYILGGQTGQYTDFSQSKMFLLVYPDGHLNQFMQEQSAAYHLQLIAVTFLIFKLFIHVIANPEDSPYFVVQLHFISCQSFQMGNFLKISLC